MREILPKKFSIGTGFIVTSADDRSSQLDIVLFDGQLNAPLSLVGDIGVFPVECVYGTIEVKSELSAKTLAQAAKSIAQIRSFKNSKYYIAQSPLLATDGRIKRLPVRQDVVIDLAPRSYVFAFRTTWSSATSVRQALEEASDK